MNNIKLIENETFTHENVDYNFSWYKIETESFNELIEYKDKIKEIINDLEKKQNTQLYFYTNILNKDAINDSVRTTIMIAFDDNEKFHLNINTSDSMMAQNLNLFIELKECFNNYLNT